ncbi:N-6 DNA methylase [Agrobacterium tumefaciens]|uniref:class I SAM-dependent DNA methyltransferase n=1 Tax=Agrobacterium tumefaciens TaxID=358 RepID=UPI003BA080E2
MTQRNIVQKIWSLCHVLRGDGIGYHQYVSELTYLLFLKIAEESGAERLLPLGYRWANLVGRESDGLLAFYQEMLTHLGNHAESDAIRAIYAFPTTVFSHSENLKAVIDGIAKIDWVDLEGDRFGQIYEGLIEKSSQDVRSGAGQYFTPRALVNCMVTLMEPKLGELIQDPAAGSGGFLIAADNYVRKKYSEEMYISNPPRYQGVEIEKNTRRICLMNTMLNGLDASIIYGDALTDDAKVLDNANLILANPPFGNKAGSRREARSDIPYGSANKQLVFLQHIYLNLVDGGRAAVVLPDNVLFEDGVGKAVRRDLMERCNLHTILRLPTGIFTSAGVKTNVLFFEKNSVAQKGTDGVWVYDLRTNMPTFGKTTPISAEHFEDFISVWGGGLYGVTKRKDQGSSGRFRYFSRSWIAARDDDLNITWLKDERNELDGSSTPGEIVAAILLGLRTATNELEAVINGVGTESEF